MRSRCSHSDLIHLMSLPLIVAGATFAMKTSSKLVAAALSGAFVLGYVQNSLAGARSLLTELASLEREVKSVSQMGPDGQAKYNQKLSDLRVRFLRSDDATSDQRRDFLKRASAISSDISRKTIKTGRSATSTTSRLKSKFPSTIPRTRSRSLSSRSASSVSSSPAIEESKPDDKEILWNAYQIVLERFQKKLPKPVHAKSGPLDDEEIKALRDDVPRFIREYSAAIKQWRLDVNGVRKAASRVSKDDSIRQRALELVEKDFPAEFQDRVADSRRTLVLHSVGLMGYVKGEYASRNRQKDNGQWIIWIGHWNLDDCVQTAWDVAELGMRFEKAFGGTSALYEEVKKLARVAARERTIKLRDRVAEARKTPE